MASVRFVAVLLLGFVALAAVCDALVLCPSFPSCCARRSCGPLCPSCREAKHFTNGVRNKPTGRGPRISFLHGDPFAFAGSNIFPDPLETIVIPLVFRRNSRKGSFAITKDVVPNESEGEGKAKEEGEEENEGEEEEAKLQEEELFARNCPLGMPFNCLRHLVNSGYKRNLGALLKATDHLVGQFIRWIAPVVCPSQAQQPTRSPPVPLQISSSASTDPGEKPRQVVSLDGC